MVVKISASVMEIEPTAGRLRFASRFPQYLVAFSPVFDQRDIGLGFGGCPHRTLRAQKGSEL
jgi:hypothetical protein